MISYRRKDFTPKVGRVSYKISRFAGIDAHSDPSALGLQYGIYGYNIACKGGTITAGFGINKPVITLADGTQRLIPVSDNYILEVLKVFLYRRTDKVTLANDDRLVVLLSDGYVYQCKVASGGYTKLAEVRHCKDKNITFLNYYLDGTDVLLICTPDGMYKYDGVSVTEVPTAPHLSSVCMHYERLFGLDATNANKIHFSNDLNPLDWAVATNGAGYISLMDEGGAIKKVLSFNDYIFIFREHAIHRLMAYTNPAEYQLTKVFDTNCMIKDDTIVVADDRIIFMADDELYSFDGYNAKRFGQGATDLIADHTYSQAGYFKNKFYLSCKLKREGLEIIGDEETPHKNNGALCFDLQNGEVSIFRGADVASFAPLISQNVSVLLVTFSGLRSPQVGIVDDSGGIFGTPLPKLWVSPKSDLGYMNKYKIVRRLYITSPNSVDITVKLDNSSETRQVIGANKPTMVTLNAASEMVSIRIATNNKDLYVSNLMLECDITRRYYAD